MKEKTTQDRVRVSTSKKAKEIADASENESKLDVYERVIKKEHEKSIRQ